MSFEPLNDLECKQLAQIMNIKHAVGRGTRFFTITVNPEKEACLVNVTLKCDDQSYYYPVQGRIEIESQNIRDSVLALLDYIDCYFEEFFQEDENIYLPIDWKEYAFEGLQFHLRGQILNLKSEAAADLLLNTENDQQV